MAEPVSSALLSANAHILDDDVMIAGVSLSETAQQFGTPFFLYDEDDIRARAHEAAAVFNDGVAYASKAFLCGAMARLVVAEGLCLDVSTAGELDLALRAGVPGSRLILHGNNKSRDELQLAVDVGARRIVLDNDDDIAHLALSLGKGQRADVMIRVTPGVEAHTHEFVQTGQEDSKFGFSLATGAAADAARAVRKIPGVRLAGFHMHIGSQIFDLTPWSVAIAAIAPLVREFDVEELCVGGGLGVAYVAGEEAPTISEWGAYVRGAAEGAGLAHVALTAEPGRSIVAPTAVTLYEVGTMKTAAQRRYIAVNGGMSDNPRPVLYGSGYEAFLLREPRASRDTSARIVGKHCESGDVLIDEAWVPDDISVGDLLVTPVTGAYGISMASNYNRVPRPPVLFARDGHVRAVQRRETFDDLARLEV